jgi:CNT family concentrative nucleoside transporter
LSTNRRAINPRSAGWGLGLQVLFALIVVKTDVGIMAFSWLGDRIQHLLAFSVEGSRFVFGPLGDVKVWSRVMNNSLGAEGGQYAVIFAFQILPTIIFIAALFAILYYIGVMQFIVRLFRS